MAINEKRLRELAQQLQDYTRAKSAPERPKLRLIVPEGARACTYLDDATRQLHERRVRFLAARYGLHWLIDQALDGATDLEDLQDLQLIELRAQFERALRCIQEGVAFEDAGLVRSCAD